MEPELKQQPQKAKQSLFNCDGTFSFTIVAVRQIRKEGSQRHISPWLTIIIKSVVKLKNRHLTMYSTDMDVTI